MHKYKIIPTIRILLTQKSNMDGDAMKALIAFCCLMYSSFSFAGDCKINGEAIMGILPDLEITGCVIDGKLVEGGGHLSGTFSVDLQKLTTGLSLRDEHMHDKYLESKKNPIAVLKLEPVKIGAKKFKGHLSLHGKTNVVEGEVLDSGSNMLKAKFIINILDYGIEKPGYKGIVIGEKITVFASVP